MSGLQAHVDEYLRLRRALGFKLKEDERTLGQLVAYLEAAGASTVITELAVRWARQPVGPARRSAAEQLADPWMAPQGDLRPSGTCAPTRDPALIAPKPRMVRYNRT